MKLVTPTRTAPEIVTRSLFPLAACALLATVPLFGPYPLLVSTFVWWRVVTRIG